MQNAKLWLINTEGQVFTLSTQSRHLRHVTSSNGDCTEFKRLCAVGQCTWALGSDHQLYVYIPSSDIPTRVQETTYENERWTPGVGWTGKKIMPGARHNWSDVNGRGVQPRENFVLPSENWEWEGPWHVDENMGGEVSGLLGWQYAVNWMGNFSAESTWRSYVRRRKWVRYRRFVSTDRWVQVAVLDDDLEEHAVPFLDLSVGGDQLPSQVDGQLLVWAVSITGRVYAREGVSFSCPEGHTWRRVPVGHHGDTGVIEVTTGPTGQVWVVTWDGEAFIRTNVSSETPYGTGWVKVPSPEDNPLQQVSVGREAVWALSRDGKIWFWNCPPGAEVFDGSWVEMVGQMAFLTLGSTDQVFAIGMQDMAVYMRTGVSPELPTGKTWQQLTIRGPRSGDFQSSLDSHTSASSSLRSSSRASLRTTSQGRSDSQLKNSLQCSNSFASSSVSSMTSDKLQNVETSVCDKISTNQKVVYVPNNRIANQTVDCTGDSCNTTQLSKNTQGVSKSAIIDETHNVDKQTSDVSNSLTHPSEQGSSNTEHSKSATEKLRLPRNRLISEGSSELDSLTSNNSDCVDFVTDLLPAEEKEEIYSHCVDQTCNFVTDLISEPSDIGVKGDKATSDNSTVTPNTTQSFPSNSVADYPLIVEVCTKGHSVKNEQADMGTYMTNGDEFVQNVTNSPTKEVPPETKDHSIAKLRTESLRKYQHSPRGGAFRDSPSVDRSSSAEDVDLDWIWVSATACNIEDSSQLPWLLAVTEDEMKDKAAIDPSTRQTILEQIKCRNAVCQKFSHYEDAIERTVWVKRGQLQLRTSLRRGTTWVNCDLDLEQGIQRNSSMDGLVYLSYTYNKKQTHAKISLVDIVCISRIADDSNKAAFAIYLPEDVEAKRSPYILSAPSETETDDWVASVAMASNVMKHRGRHSIDSATYWAVTELGDVFVHQHPGKTQRLSQTHWEQIGGHMLMVQTNSRGVTWAISHDHTAYIYTGGFGGGIFKGIVDASQEVYSQTDVRTLCIYENQKWHLVTGFSHRLLLANKYAWTDETGKIPLTMDAIQPPSSSWQWVDDWKVDFSAPGGVDVDGWQYASSLPSQETDYHRENNWRDSYRRRKWVRHCRATTTGPWLPVGPLSLIDVSVGPLDAAANVTELWAVGENGDALFRSGVTIDKPQGESWCHVAADQSFCAISVGGNHWLWAVARGGSVWFRSGITADNPTGKVWLQVVPPPPGGHPLQQISVGDNSVWAVDTNKCLWRRKDTTVIFPEGTEWELVSKDIRQVSVGPGDQVFALRDNVAGKKSHVNGVISRRCGITVDKPSGTDWVDGIGGIWSGVCCRGFVMAGE